MDDSATAGTVNLELATIDGKSVQVVRYTPATGFNGTDQFRYTIVDSNGTTSTGTVTVQVGKTRTSDDLVRIRLETRDLNGNLITQIGQGMQFQVWAYVRDMRNVAGYASVPGFPQGDQGVFSAYMDLLYDTDSVSYAGVDFSTDYSAGHFVDAGVPGILDEIGAFQGSGSDNNFGNPYGPSEKLLYKATFTATELGTARFKSDPADDIPLHETSLNIPPGTLDYSQIDFRATTIDVINSPDLVQIRLAATTIAGAPLSQVTAGTEFYVKAYVDDLGIRNTIPSFPQSQEGVFSAYLDIVYNSGLAQPVAVPTSQNPLGFDITAGSLFQEGLKGINRTTAGIVDEVGAFQGGTATRFPDERLLFQIRFRALSGPGGTLTFTADAADEPVNETTLIKPDPGVSVPTAQVRYVSATPITVIGGAGEGEFTNPNNRYDVTNDGIVTPGDVLAVVNLLNSSGTTALTPTAGGEGEAGRMYYDVNSDYLVSPIDVLSVINFINGATSQATGEGEASAVLFAAAPSVEAGWGGGLPAENLDQSPRAAPVRRYGSPRGFGRGPKIARTWTTSPANQPRATWGGLGSGNGPQR